MKITGKNILNDVIFNLVKVLKGVLVLINVTLYFFALFKKKITLNWGKMWLKMFS